MTAAKPPRRPTLKDIARALGVSLATVSNAYNRPDQLSEALRTRILDTARSLGYSGPDPLASSLRRGRAGAIGVLYGDPLSYAFADPAAALFLQGLASAVETSGLNLLLLPFPNDPQAVSNAPVDGLVVYSLPDDSASMEAALARAVPSVLVDQRARAGFTCVSIEDVSGARQAAAHLLALGHRRLAVLSLDLAIPRRRGRVTPARLRAARFRPPLDRLDGYRDAVQAAGVPWSSVTVMEVLENSTEEGERLAGALLDGPARPTAILAMSDQLALGALQAAARRRLRVPADLSVVGYDDVPAAAAVGLTTVRQPTVAKGRLAGELLLGLLAGQAPTSPAPLATELVVRGSSAAPT